MHNVGDIVDSPFAGGGRLRVLDVGPFGTTYEEIQTDEEKWTKDMQQLKALVESLHASLLARMP